eukprot:1463322-Amphidinium_carterae.5
MISNDKFGKAFLQLQSVTAQIEKVHKIPKSLTTVYKGAKGALCAVTSLALVLRTQWSQASQQSRTWRRSS